ncbi:double-strand break repair helicase AddA [Paracoccus endophyticus]|uniref:double-strand break repair helicase AddA n=1 Tax=Paracoccus endophyticus TaxID=2233774 RepID=UPI000DD8DB49|nr:double-strand break repair helicase AddA [Paracoccus endophyticus]
MNDRVTGAGDDPAHAGDDGARAGQEIAPAGHAAARADHGGAHAWHNGARTGHPAADAGTDPTLAGDLDAATLAQHRAADPACSTWLTANAGSGKTSVLTDRVARLLLGGTRPERVLCLTYTKAAATEMQNRLLSRLGQWAMLDDAALTGRLDRMGVPPGADLAAARRLFAQAIETPGGLKVQTIHSFCGAILRRFPLEAGVPHGFAELDDRSAAGLRADIIEQMARESAPEMADLLALQSDHDLDRFLAGLRDFDAPPCPARVWDSCGLPAGLDAARLLADCFPHGEAHLIAALIPLLRAAGGTMERDAGKLDGGRWDAPGLDELRRLESVFITASGPKAGQAKIGNWPTRALQGGSCAALMGQIDALMSRVEAARPLRIMLDHAQRTLALQRFGHAFCTRYAAAKRARGWLDFDDLIDRTADLLGRASMAQWVLFRLDGGIDHILVDEAQDTSPRQWQVIERLTAEFTAGEGATDRPRTLFVVGDPKQSIYSFQGADIAVFRDRHQGFSDAFAAAGSPMQDAALRHSFRSSPAILSLTDATFRGPAAEGLGEVPRHIAHRAAMPGRVDLWPPVPDPEQPADGRWFDPVDRPAPNAAGQVLARAVARAVREMVGQPFQPREGGARPIRPGDVLILVQRRSALFHDIILALKQQGLPVAGADRLKLAGELAVADIRALLSVLATPEDDLSLAAALRSPLFGLSEDDLYRLAAPRKGLLIEALRHSLHAEAMEILEDLMRRADFLRPHDLISRLLIRHDGRARLIARLGPEAQDGIDELLGQALTYETAEVPSLTGFLVWLATGDIEVRRQPGPGGGGLVRVMTAHGAKGLESPIVILPDCAARKREPTPPRTILPEAGTPAHWRGSAAERPDRVAAWAERDRRRAEEERRRLLYVAMTRAESWLVVAAAGETGTGLDSWHAMVAAGFDGAHGLSETPLPTAWGQGRRLAFGDWPLDAKAGDRAPGDAPALPGWALRIAPRMDHPPAPVAATALGGAKALAPAGAAEAGGDGDRQAAMLAGTRLHLLLEHLPGRERAEWPALTRAALAGAEGGLPGRAELAGLLAEAEAVIDAEPLAHAWDPPGATVLREAALTAPLPGGRVLSGSIDRLIVTADRVTAIDYKSNEIVPDTPDGVPAGILRQMAAYRHALRAIWPGRPVETAILWTRSRSLMALPDAALDTAWAEALAGLGGAAPSPGLDPGDRAS